MDDFEQRLKQQSRRQIPAEWRREIIAAAMSRKPTVESQGQDNSQLSMLVSRLSTIFWPHPKAWAGLAAIWVFILIVNFSIRDQEPVVAEKVSPPSPEVMAELKQQKLMFAQLLGTREETDADRSKIFVPLPRSERVEMMTA